MGIRISRLQVWQRQYRGSRRTMRTATSGTRTGSSSFFSNIHMIHVYMPIFNGSPNFEVTSVKIKRSCICITYIFEKMNNSLSWSLGLLFSLFTWTLDMTFVTLVTSEFGFSLKNWHINMYHRYIWKNELLPVLVPGVAVLVVPLDPQYCLCHTCNLKIRISIEKLAYKHISYVYLKKNELLPVLVPGVAVLVVPLDPRFCLCHTCNLEIRIPIEKLAYKHISYVYLKKWTTPCPGPWGCRSRCSPGPSIWPLSTL